MAALDTGKSETGIATFDGTSPAASFTRMVHAGIEHALLQLVSEAFDLTQRMLALNDEQWRDFSQSRSVTALDEHLTEVSGCLFDYTSEEVQRRQLREKLNAVKSDPENLGILQSARDLGVPTPTIDAALGAQDCSPGERQMTFLLTPFRHPSGRFENDADSVLKELYAAFYAAMAITYAQGFALLSEASARYRFNLNPAEIARVWKIGSNARTEILDDIASAFAATPALRNILCDEDISDKVMARQESLRHAVWRAGELDAFAPGMLASLDYLDSFKDAWLPVNLVQVQRRGLNEEMESASKTPRR
jgi:6-phosphogluconate dehydrogenase